MKIRNTLSNKFARNCVISGIFTVATMFSSAAFAEQGRYISIALGKAGGPDYSTSAGALGTWYKGGSAEAKLDGAGVGAIAIGTSLGSSPFRAELSLSNHSHSGDLSSANFLPASASELAATSIPSKLTVSSANVALFYDFPLVASFEPYIGLGGGMSKVKIVDHVSTFDNSKALPNFVGVAGLNYKMTDNTLGFFEVRQEVISGAKVVISPEKSEDLSSLGVSFGLRFYF